MDRRSYRCVLLALFALQSCRSDDDRSRRVEAEAPASRATATEANREPLGGGAASSAVGAEFEGKLAELERSAGGRLGVAVLDAETGEVFGHRTGERFGMCSTFKLALAAIILDEVDAGRLTLEQRVSYSEVDVLSYAPVTATNVAKGWLTVEELAEAAQTTSDNTAANLLLKLIGGPGGFTSRLVGYGDRVTRLDRFEPEMNLVPPGEERDTTTPRAMATLVGQVFASDLLTGDSRALLKKWTIDTMTGRKRLRAGMPSEWQVGDKTGTAIGSAASAMVNKHNDVAIVWRPTRRPLVVATYYDAPSHFDAPRAQDDAVLASVGELVAAHF